MKSSFGGCFDEIPQIYADNFERRDRKVYFLSHYHSDHTVGLSDAFLSDLRKREGFIYTSKITAEIIKHEHGRCYKDSIRSLPIDTSDIHLPSEDGGEILSVTLIPAGHCYGSVMFLFKYKGENILFTGDFRIRSNDINKFGQLHENNEPIKLDALYIDTTFIDEKFDVFPKRTESVQSAVNYIRNWLNKSNGEVRIWTSAKFGYEYVFNELYKQLGIKVQVTAEKWKLYQSLGDVIGVTDDDSKIHLCWRKCNICGSIKRKDVLNVRFVAMSFNHLNSDDDPFELNDEWLKVCFATHCSSTELKDFIYYFYPKKIVGFPNQFVESPKKVSNDFKMSPRKRILTNDACGEKKKSKVTRELFNAMCEL